MTDETSTDRGPRSPTDPASNAVPAPSVTFLLIALGRRARDAVEAQLREHGLAYHHLSALGHLQRQPGLSYSELARRARVTVQSMQTTASHLEQHGYIERGASTSKGRRADLHVTVDGRRVLAAAEATIRMMDHELLANIPDGERATVETALLYMFTGGGADDQPGR